MAKHIHGRHGNRSTPEINSPMAASFDEWPVLRRHLWDVLHTSLVSLREQRFALPARNRPGQNGDSSRSDRTPYLLKLVDSPIFAASAPPAEDHAIPWSMVISLIEFSGKSLGEVLLASEELELDETERADRVRRRADGLKVVCNAWRI
jgi:hypothetical protein